MRYRFYKTNENRWFIDIPGWYGSIEELEMVCGADTMLDIISEGESELFLYISKVDFANSNKLIFKGLSIDLGEGADYILENYNGIEYNLDIWLCGVTEYVFKCYPGIIFFSKS